MVPDYSRRGTRPTPIGVAATVLITRRGMSATSNATVRVILRPDLTNVTTTFAPGCEPQTYVNGRLTVRQRQSPKNWRWWHDFGARWHPLPEPAPTPSNAFPRPQRCRETSCRADSRRNKRKAYLHTLRRKTT